MSFSRQKTIIGILVGLSILLVGFFAYTNNVAAQNICSVVDAYIEEVSGTSTSSSWYHDDPETLVNFVIKTSNCSGKKIKSIKLRSVEPAFDQNVSDITDDVLLSRDITVDDQELVKIRMRAGENACKVNPDGAGSFQCNYRLNISYDGIAGTTANYSDGPVFKYNCDGEVNDEGNRKCENGKWTGVSPNGLERWKVKSILVPTNPYPSPDAPEPQEIELFGGETECPEENPNCVVLLAPLPGLEDYNQDTKVGEYINIMVRLIIGIISLLAVIMIVVGGVQYMTTDALTGKQSARETITNAVLGLLLAVGSFVLLYTINPQLLDLQIEDSIGTANITYDGGKAVIGDDGNFADPETNDSITVCNGNTLTPGESWINMMENVCGYSRITLPSGVSTNNPECQTMDLAGGCTSLYFEASAGAKIVAALNTMLADSNVSSIVVTGGSEAWLHTTHRPERAIIDVRPEPNVNNFLVQNSTFPASCTPQTPSGTSAQNIISQVIDESACWNVAEHWHIIFR